MSHTSPFILQLTSTSGPVGPSWQWFEHLAVRSDGYVQGVRVRGTTSARHDLWAATVATARPEWALGMQPSAPPLVIADRHVLHWTEREREMSLVAARALVPPEELTALIGHAQRLDPGTLPCFVGESRTGRGGDHLQVGWPVLSAAAAAGGEHTVEIGTPDADDDPEVVRRAEAFWSLTHTTLQRWLPHGWSAVEPRVEPARLWWRWW